MCCSFEHSIINRENFKHVIIFKKIIFVNIKPNNNTSFKYILLILSLLSLLDKYRFDLFGALTSIWCLILKSYLLRHLLSPRPEPLFGHGENRKPLIKKSSIQWSEFSVFFYLKDIKYF